MNSDLFLYRKGLADLFTAGHADKDPIGLRLCLYIDIEIPQKRLRFRSHNIRGPPTWSDVSRMFVQKLRRLARLAYASQQRKGEEDMSCTKSAKCIDCGRRLKDAKSIAAGRGPICRERAHWKKKLAEMWVAGPEEEKALHENQLEIPYSEADWLDDLQEQGVMP